MAFADYPTAQPRSDVRRLPLLVQLHDWVVTVDHKRLGLMYICTGLVFFVVGEIEASIMRWQLAFPPKELPRGVGWFRSRVRGGLRGGARLFARWSPPLKHPLAGDALCDWAVSTHVCPCPRNTWCPSA